ncbi:zinc ABC transporter substrate-binding protein [Colwellia sp. MB02u-18]|uniref:metal ABC transporter solute-binding protein, Zn/Mn family n=1 Tax=unclassified Colwellia TaxID=196834 RepID=UPI0015F61CCA|nr:MULTISPECIES: zinc ABC transporter substrate-binding protein [unclassified Colwellia]MBA6222861.1 zinc ABC transporter substrate-binding protein [Colwellia sp. MB3u-45]MBA6266161.1 zinc ABC transporter substrate-binding protein [Colwellia sp. MB3u-43]MBA6319747.1 zinc ABC transporter substrate-binding protein [Colwellia sp. MB02u-19]MBA6324950.1 zinc ABC transporter substrate-binding protein [Colwellia sp. MB02u-18]MBA6329738.1 zinc ABC transporter substrate-binding protein [Colwellia sp. M
MRINFKLLLGSALLTLSHGALAQMNIFACEPEYAALAKELAPDARIYSATTAMQDPHQVQARPSLIAKMRQTDLVICAGAELEVGWLPMLQMKAANVQVRSTDKGLFFAAEQVKTLDQMSNVDRSMGDVHSLGNPHVHFSPPRMLTIAQALTDKLIQLDEEQSAKYQQQLSRFSARWQLAMTQWQVKARGLQGMKVIAYHSSFRYLFDFANIEQVADLEPKPGLPPTSSHLASLLKRADNGDIAAIIIASYQDQRGANWLAEKSNLPVIVLPLSVGGNEQSKDLFSLYDSTLDLLTQAYRTQK